MMMMTMMMIANNNDNFINYNIVLLNAQPSPSIFKYYYDMRR
jgi:hypothetical protein